MLIHTDPGVHGSVLFVLESVPNAEGWGVVLKHHHRVTACSCASLGEGWIVEIVSWQTLVFNYSYHGSALSWEEKMSFLSTSKELVWPKCLSVLQVHRNLSGARTVHRLCL